jgi:HK97 family phage portal protein
MQSIASTFKTGNKKWMVSAEGGWAKEGMQPTVDSMEKVLSNEKLVFGVPKGVVAQSISLDPKEAGYIEAMGFSAKDIARIFGVPASIIGADDGANKGSVEQDYLNFINQTLLPWAVNIESELKMKLFTEREKQFKYFKFNFNSLMRADATARGEFYSKMLLNGVLNRNEVRAMEDLNPYGDGNEYMVPFNEVAASQFTAITQAKIDAMEQTVAQTNNPNGNN